MKEKVIEFTKRNMAYILILGIFAFFLFMQYHLVGMYYDDFGNASLSYGYDSSNISGTDYTIKDLLEWAKYIYMNWGGRIIYALMLIPLLKTGAHIYMAIQVVIILATYVVMSMIVKEYSDGKNHREFVLFIFIISYLCLKGDILTMGFYWASASCLYVWPLLPLMLTILLYIKCKTQIKNDKKASGKIWGGLVFTIPLVTLSQEQLGGTLVVLFLFCLIIDIYKFKKQFVKLDVIILGYSALTFMLFFVAPGNWARLDSNKEYSSLSIIGKLKYSCPKVLSLVTNPDLGVFNLLLILCGLIIIWRIKKNHSIAYIIISVIMILPFGIVDIIDVFNILMVKEAGREICYIIFIFDMFFLLWNYFNDINKLDFIPFMIAAVTSIFCLVVSPSFAMRSCIPYVFLCVLMVGTIMNNEFSILKIGVMLIIWIQTCFNAARIYRGYEENYYMDNLNYNILANYDGQSDSIYLLRYANSRYRAQMSCDEGFEWIDFWIREYFDIPQSTEIVWRTMEEYLEYANSVEFDVEYGDGFYNDEGGWRWSEDNSQFIITNNTGTASIVNLNFSLKTGYEDMASIKLFCNDEQIAELSADSNGIVVNQVVELKPGDNVFNIASDAKQIDSGSDSRSLYMVVGKIKCYPVKK